MGHTPRHRARWVKRKRSILIDLAHVSAVDFANETDPVRARGDPGVDAVFTVRKTRARRAILMCQWQLPIKSS